MPSPGSDRRAAPAGWVYTVMVVIAVAVVIWVFAVRWRHTTASASPPVTPPQVPNTLYNQRILTVDSIYRFPNAGQLVGMRLEVPAARVRRVLGDGLFYIGDVGMPWFLVAPNTPQSPARGIAVDRDVAISGTFEKLPGIAEIQKRWHVDRSTAEAIARQGAVYVEADEVWPSGATHGAPAGMPRP